ncbi:phosphoribosylanthranilate isomerase [Parvularcula maris]|uniref:N-(5'-phosphoribosyl)anthranilate isomerase n=1 Tax=Parvularcula maris TaxID=2965077 RepID=A0A9X2L6K8_9PROT|nr:phosphoribosylanthranilate isomerase [Parvularcula maris]MCQ8183896.1 phosphoribosylanthranilate isomerase [Parvularcula maris]
MAQPLLIKICGLRRPEDANAAVEAGAQLGGLVFARQSPRHVSLREARQVRDVLFGRAEVVGLFADNAFEEVAATHQAVGLDRVQLHGQEDDAFAERVEAEIGLPVLRAVAVSEAKEAEAADGRSGSALLFDAKPPDGSAQQGGHGQAFDWGLLDGYRGERKFLLGGGLTPGNVGKAVSRMQKHPSFAGVDVSSGVEREKGVKDAELIAAFTQAARAAR